MLAVQDKPIFYPESDGKPMAETDVHRKLLNNTIDLLQNAFPDAYVSGNICLYYEKGNPKKMISPDALLCLSQSPHQKRTYRTWEEHAQLDLVMEFSSFSTQRIDHNKKKNLYQDELQVPYYVIFDPHGVYLTTYERINGDYQLIEADEKGRCHLPDLGLQVGIEDGNGLRLYDKNGTAILNSAEQGQQTAHNEAQRADNETQRANDLEKQLQQVQKELQALRANAKE